MTVPALGVDVRDPRVTGAAIALIQREEGFRDRAYQCTAGVWTIGYGRTEGVRPGQTTTREAEDRWLRQYVAGTVQPAIAAKVGTLQLPVDCWAALCSWTYNVGTGPSWHGSAVWRALAAGRLEQVDDALLRWVRRRDPATGQLVVDPGLRARRAREAALWNSGLSALRGADPEAEAGPIAGEDSRSTLATDTVRGSTAATAATAATGAITAVAPQLWGLDWRVAVAIVLSVAVIAVLGVVWWRSRRP